MKRSHVVFQNNKPHVLTDGTLSEQQALAPAEAKNMACENPKKTNRMLRYDPLEGMSYTDVLTPALDLEYDILARIGQGTFGEVFKARDKKTRDVVAVKKILTDHETEGFPITAIREVKILQVVDHPNIVKLLTICSKEVSQKWLPDFYLVFEFCEHDLAGLLGTPIRFSMVEIKCILKQLLEAVHYMHFNHVFHRDMKTSNILVTKEGVVKVADYGLARAFSSDPNRVQRYTNRVVTLWYRPPELLLGARDYTKAIDMWGVGCIMAELWALSPILQGDSELNQLKLIISLCGSITPEVWPGVDKLQLYSSLKDGLPQNKTNKLKDCLARFVKDKYALNLIQKLMTLNPAQRMSAHEALDHPFLWRWPEGDSRVLASRLGKLTTSHMDLFTSSRHRAQHQTTSKKQPEEHYLSRY